MLRKLGNKEESTFKRLTANVFAITFRVESKIDLYANIEVVKEAIYEWKQTHPLLRSRIVKNNNEEYYFSLNKKYSNRNYLRNIKFLNCELPSLNLKNEFDLNNILESLSNLLLENEYLKPIEISDILWKLIFLKIDNYDKNYEVIFICHHSISEAKCSHNVFLLLLETIEKIYTRKFKKIEQHIFKICPNVEELFKSALPDIKNSEKRDQIPRPSFMTPSIDKIFSNNSIRFPNQKDIEHARIYSLDEDKENNFLTVKDLLEMTRLSNNKHKKVIFDSDIYTKMLSKCKEEKVKLTSFFDILLSLAIKRLYDRHGQDSNEKNIKTVYSYIAVSLRQFKPIDSVGFNDYFTMGYYVGGLLKKFSEDIKDIHDKNEYSMNFWRWAHRNSIDFHNKLASDEKLHFKFKSQEESNDELNFHFILSNIGVVNSSLHSNPNNSLIKVKSSFISSHLHRNSNERILSNFISTIDNRLNLLITYNSFLVKQEIIDDYVNSIFDLLRDIV